jgi:hypothetical protein
LLLILHITDRHFRKNLKKIFNDLHRMKNVDNYLKIRIKYLSIGKKQENAACDNGNHLNSKKENIDDNKMSYKEKCKEGKRRKINIECEDTRRLCYFIFTTVIDSSKFHARMFLKKMSSVFRSLTYYIHARTKKKENKFRQRNRGRDILDYYH